METFSQSKTLMDDHNNVKFKSLYIDLDLAMPRNSNSPRAVRRLQKSLDSHEEFEFTMSSNISMKDDIFEPVMEVASADKLFFRGQLLPLQQQDPLHHLAHTMVFPKEEICGEKGASFSRHYADFLSFQLPNEDNNYSCDVGTFPKLQFSSQIGTCHRIMKQAANYEEGVIPSEFSLRDQIDLMRSCRLDGVFDPYKNDSRSSSFRSHQSSYWSSGEKDSRDSISSSRCSIGSYQDSCFQSAERKAPQISVNKANPLINTNANAEINECNIGIFYANGDPKHSRNNYGKPPIPSSSTRKWSWKGFFTGLGRASRLKADEERGDKGKVKGKSEIKEMNKRSVFTFKELPGVMGEPASYNRRSDAGQDWEWQANTYQFVCSEGSNVKKGRKPAREDNYEDQGTVYCLRSGGRQEAGSFINGSSSSSKGNIVGEGTSPATKKERRKVLQGNTSTWNARESWNRCVNKVKKGTRLSTYNSSGAACKLQPKQLNIALQGGKNMNAALNMMNEEDQKMDIYRVNYMKAKSLSSTPLAKSPVRRAHEYNGISSGGGGYIGSLYCMQGGAASLAASSSSASASSSSTMSKTMNKKVGFAASCPASMRSSPHHSGLLAVVNKATPDLHTAIQGAIAYCKQSQAALNPP